MTRFDMTYEEAQAAAEAFAREHDGWVTEQSRVIDDRTRIDEYGSEEAANLCWSGETPAISVLSNSDFSEIGVFAYWE